MTEKKLYKVLITETLQKTVLVEAAGTGSAQKGIRCMEECGIHSGCGDLPGRGVPCDR